MKRKEEKKWNLSEVAKSTARHDEKRFSKTTRHELFSSPIFSFFSTVITDCISCGLYQLPTKACHNMELVMEILLKGDRDTINSCYPI